MSELEFEIGRQFGSTSFYLYTVVKHNPKMSLKELEVESGMTDRVVKVHLKKLVDCNILHRKRVFLKYCRGFIYTTVEDKTTWKLH